MEKKVNSSLGMIIITAVFFIFGFATTFIITLSSKIKDIFTISEFQAQLSTAAFFVTYLVVSIPSGYLIRSLGYKKTLFIGLLLMAVGSFLFYPAAGVPSFPLFLVATFVLAIGVVFLQVSANPYASALGSEESAPARLNLTQALNSVATMLAPWLIGVFIFKGVAENLSSVESAASVQMPFLIMGSIIIAIAVIFLMLRMPELGRPEHEDDKGKSMWKFPHVWLGAVAIFFYVGAEVGNAGLLVNYLKTLSFADGHTITAQEASKYAAIYWGGAMIGRFFASVMQAKIANMGKKALYVALILILAFVSGAFVTDWNWKIGFGFFIVAIINFVIMQLGTGKANRILAIFAITALLLDITTVFTTGNIALWTIISIGFFNSVMFPNIFALAVKDLHHTELSKASGLINMLIFGGAVIPLVMGAIVGEKGGEVYTWAFIIPVICYAYIAFYALRGAHIRNKK